MAKLRTQDFRPDTADRVLAEYATSTDLDKAFAMLLVERISHSRKGYTANHDDAHHGGELAEAAACYAAASAGNGEIFTLDLANKEAGKFVFSELWPWDDHHDRRDDHSRLQLLSMAGALILAEIERLLRAKHQIEVREADGKREVRKPLRQSSYDQGMYRG